MKVKILKLKKLYICIDETFLVGVDFKRVKN